jgi:putative ABC transport system substrate-binding protein
MGSPNWQAMVEGLRERGYVQGQNLILECRYTEGQPERAPALAAELVSLRVDLFVAFLTTNVRAAKQATSTLPIVMVGVIDPVERGLVASLARPGGNVTGVTQNAGGRIKAKNLQILKELVPATSHVADLEYMIDPREPDRHDPETEAAVRALGVTVQPYAVRGPEGLEDAFASITKARAQALIVGPHPFVLGNARRIIEFAAQRRLPAAYPSREFVEAGGLMSYATYRSTDNFRRIGYFVDKIFKGANPGNLPVEQPTRFELVINIKTARALGLTIPQSVLLQADEVIQ